MTFTELVQFVTRTFYLVLAIITLIKYIRYRSKAALNVALLFGSLGALIVVNEIVRLFDSLQWMVILSSMLLVAQPYLLLRVVWLLQPQAQRVEKLALLVMSVCWAFIIFFEDPLPGIPLLLVVLYYVLLQGYSAFILIQGAFFRSGIAQHRLQFAALGSLGLGAVIFLAGVRRFWPPASDIIPVWSSLIAIASGASYYLAFATPRWMRKTWQSAELYEFIHRNITSSATQGSSDQYTQLAQSALRTVGGQAAVVIPVSASEQHSVVQLGDPLAARKTLLEEFDQKIVGLLKHFTHSRYVTSVGREAFNPLDEVLADFFESDTIFFIPIETAHQQWGTLLLFLSGTPIFETDDLDLLSLFAEQTAVSLDYMRLFDQRFRDEQRLIFDISQDPLCVLDSDGRFLMLNSAWRRVLGYDHEDLYYKLLLDYVHVDDRKAAESQIQTAMQSKEVVSFVLRMVGKDETIKWFSCNAAPRRTQQSLYLTAHDITKLKEAEELLAALNLELRRERERLNSLIASVPGVVWEAWGTPDEEAQHIDYVSDYVEDMLGYTPEEWLSTPNFWLKIVHPDDKERAAAIARDKFESGEGGGNEFRWIKKNGEAIWCYAQSSVIKDIEGNPIGLRGVTLDISSRKQMEELRSRLAAIVESSADAIIGKTMGGIINSWNKGAEEIYGYTPEEILGKHVDTLVPDDYRAELNPIFEAIGEGRSYAKETIRIHKDGKRIPISLTVSPIIDADNRIIGAASIARDITERKKSELELVLYAEKLRQSNKALEEFAYIASHDLQEPLRKIQAFSDRLSIKLDGSLDEQGQDYLARLQNAAVRMQHLIQDLLTYSRLTSNARPFVEVNLNDVMKQVLSDLETQIQETNAQIEVGELATLEADYTRMCQLFQNLISNALKYHHDKRDPIVKISGRYVSSQPLRASDMSTLIKNQQYEISVADNGIGFDEKYQEKIFEFFQRLHGRSKYEGTGIGLTICRKIVDQHEGKIFARGVPGQGATFTVILPITHVHTSEGIEELVQR